jgi:Fur family transcriptional regulator, ferric uptake regulator
MPQTNATLSGPVATPDSPEPGQAPAASGAAAVRNTRQKEAIREAISAAGRPLSPEEILQAAQQGVSTLSLATVYRNIASLQRDGWLQAVTLPGMPARYEVAGKAHHHHFHCNECGKVYEMEGCGFEFHAKLPQGFTATAHELFLSGRCAACR